VTPEQWHAMIADEAPGIYFTPPENRGQIVTRSYAASGEYIWELTVDGTDGSRVVKVYEGTEEPFDPWNGAPSLGELLWTEVAS